jgi:FAD/FMN-containing dehydrogenase
MDAARFGDALASMDGVVKKLVCVLAAPIAQHYFKGFPTLAEGEAVVLAMVAPPYLDAVAPVLARHRGREVARARTEDAPVPAYEFTWNHTTLQALKVDRSITYLQTLFPAPDHLALIARMEREFGDEVPIHLEYVRLGGRVCCFGLQLLRFTTEERLNEIIRIHEDAGAPIFNPHAFTLEEGGMKQVDAAQLAFKREADPLGLLNPGKMLAWDDPDWTPDRPGKVYLFPPRMPRTCRTDAHPDGLLPPARRQLQRRPARHRAGGPARARA